MKANRVGVAFMVLGLAMVAVAAGNAAITCEIWCGNPPVLLGSITCTDRTYCCQYGNCSTWQYAGTCCGQGQDCDTGVDDDGNPFANCVVNP